MTTLYGPDPFTASNGTAALTRPPWNIPASGGTWTVSSNQMTQTDAFGARIIRYNDTINGDQWIELDINAVNSLVIICLRFSNANNDPATDDAYIVNINPDGSGSAVATTVGWVGNIAALAPPFTLRVEVQGDQFRVFRNGGSIINATDTGATRLTGQPAIADQPGAAPSSLFDNVSVGDFLVITPHPQVATSNSENGTSLGSANAQVLPTSSAAGDLILYVVGHDNPGVTALTASTGWASLSARTHGSNVIKADVFARILDGTSGDNICSVSGAAQDYVVLGLRIPTGEHGVTNVATDIKIGGADAASGNADPPSLDAGSSKDWLWLAAAIVDMTTGNTISAMPSGYTQIQNVKSANSTSSVGVAVAWEPNLSPTQTEDPPAFANNTQEWIAYTIAIPDFVVAGATPAEDPMIVGQDASTVRSYYI